MPKRNLLLPILMLGLSLLFANCSGDGEDTTASSTSPSTTPEKVVTVMTYNICGAGVTTCGNSSFPDVDQRSPEERLEKLLEVIRAVDPDIIGIQEAWGWDAGTPSIAEQVAEELNMNFFMPSGVNRVDPNFAIFTKYDITEEEDLRSEFLFSAVMRATIITPEGVSLHVFNAHLKAPLNTYVPPDLSNLTPLEINKTDAELLVSGAIFYADDNTIVMGDMNNSASVFAWLGLDSTDAIESQFSEAGFYSPSDGQYIGRMRGIDQIWVSSILSRSFNLIDLPEGLPEDISDHEPIIAQIGIDDSEGQ